MAEEALRAAYEKAYSGPGRIRVNPPLQRSAITALGIHCLFVDAGFVPQNVDQGKPSSPLRNALSQLFGGERHHYRPPEYWLALQPSPEFMFRYTYPGKCAAFVCHCSVKLDTEQMFVHVSEEGNSENIQFVGLLVHYTVPQGTKDELKQLNSWNGVLGDLDLLAYNVETYLLEPLLRKAVDQREFQRHEDDAKAVWQLGNGWVKYGALLVLLGFITTSLMQHRHHT